MIIMKSNFEYPENISKIGNKTALNIYVIKHEDKVIQIDAGIRNDINKIYDFYEQKNEEPDYILITSVDYTHVGALKELYDRYKPKIFVTKSEMDTMIHGPAFRGIMEIEGKGLRFDGVKNISSYNRFNLDFLKIIDTPGYTNTNISIYYEHDNAIFVGDALIVKRNKIKLDKMFIQDIRAANLSLEKIKSMKPVTVYPSHGEPYKLM